MAYRRQRAAYDKLGIGPNAVLMVGHGAVRRLVMKEDHKRPATADEIRRMRELVRQGMQEKAFGLSAGLEYVPGIWSTTEELIELVREIVPFGGPVANIQAANAGQILSAGEPRYIQLALKLIW